MLCRTGSAGAGDGAMQERAGGGDALLQGRRLQKEAMLRPEGAGVGLTCRDITQQQLPRGLGLRI